MAITLVESQTAVDQNTHVEVASAAYSDIQDGDVLVFALALYFGSTATISSVETLDAELFVQTTAAWDNSSFLGIYVVTDAGSLPVEWRFNATSGGEFSLVGSVFRGVDLDTVPVVAITENNGEADPNPSARGLTTTEDGQFLFTTRHLVNSANFVCAAGPPSGYAAGGFAYTNQVWPDDSVAEIAFKEIPSAGVETPGVWSNGVENGHTEWIVMSFALTAAAPVGGNGAKASSLGRRFDPGSRRFL